jgi:hypothetical protein
MSRDDCWQKYGFVDQQIKFKTDRWHEEYRVAEKRFLNRNHTSFDLQSEYPHRRGPLPKLFQYFNCSRKLGPSELTLNGRFKLRQGP